MREAGSFWTSSFSQALDWVFPRKCALCGLAGLESPCASCSSEMVLALPDFVGADDGELRFRACRYAYQGRAAQAVRCLKYSRSTSLVSFMAGVVAARLSELGIDGELVVPVPMNPGRWSWRGFNQSELLVEKCGLEVRADGLRRIRNTRPQVGLSLKERQDNLRGAFRASECVRGRDVILVDDVVTSGQTGLECARALREKGAKSVGIVAFAGNLL